jgi:ABC-type transporter Mla MlaB component
MTLRMPTVAVKELSDMSNMRQGRLFLGELKSYMNIVRPCIVIDCSKVGEMGGSAIHLLLCCLEEAMKRNGDIRLAAVSAGARVALKVAGVDRLFEIFDTTAEAVDSFRRLQIDTASPEYALGNLHRASENAA